MSVFVIAEAGVNHNGCLETAIRMIETAKECGADAVKFQTFVTSEIITENSEKAEYQKETTGADETQYQMVKKLELDVSAHHTLKKKAEELGIIFMSTPFDLPSIELLHGMGMEIFKIPSGEITHLRYLRALAKLNKKYIISTGMCNLGEVEDALKVFYDASVPKENITVLHANTQYPTPFEDVNLNAMVSMGNHLGLTYGYSDHTLGIEVDIAAVALGATVIEKHFTLDKNQDGPDHRASLEPSELKAMITSIRNIEKALGDGIKRPSKSETPNIAIARKSLVAKCGIKEGELFTEENLTAKRPAGGISPMLWDSYIGTPAHKDYARDEQI